MKILSCTEANVFYTRIFYKMFKEPTVCIIRKLFYIGKIKFLTILLLQTTSARMKFELKQSCKKCSTFFRVKFQVFKSSSN